MSTKRFHSGLESDSSESDSEQSVEHTVKNSSLETNPVKTTDSSGSDTDSTYESESSLDDDFGDQGSQYDSDGSLAEQLAEIAEEAVKKCMHRVRMNSVDFDKEGWPKLIDFIFEIIPPESLQDFLMRDPLDLNGLSRDQLSAIPIFEYRDQQLDSEVCSLCNNRFNVGDFLRKLSCDHVYHTDCSYEVLRKTSQCPTCKISLLPNENQDQNP